MVDSTGGKRRFFGYPKAVEAPSTPYKKADDANPIFSGGLLVVGAWLYVCLSLLTPHAADLLYQSIQIAICSTLPMV